MTAQETDREGMVASIEPLFPLAALSLIQPSMWFAPFEESTLLVHFQFDIYCNPEVFSVVLLKELLSILY